MHLRKASLVTFTPANAPLVGGEPVSQRHAPKTTRLFSCQAEIIENYGPTETIQWLPPRVILARSEDECSRSSIDRPSDCEHTRIYILDTYGDPVPVGVPGGLFIGGTGVARGYLNRPELTAEKLPARTRLLPSPTPACTAPETLDAGLDDGNIEFLGRNDFQVKIRGLPYRTRRDRGQACMEHPGSVRDADCHSAREDVPGEKRLVAYYTGAEEAVRIEELRSHLSATLPEYMVPAAYVWLESLPLTPNGKLDRKALPAPDGDAYATHGYEPPQGEIEEKLAIVWAEVLRLDKVGRHDNFFELGGHSLLAITLIERMRRNGFKMDVRTLFATPTLADLAASVDSGASAIEVPPNLIPSPHRPSDKSSKVMELSI